MSLQKTFLRVLQERRFRPIGSKQEVTSDFRLVAATNRNLDAMVEAGRFRNDLLYRLRAFNLDLPPLRVRPTDIKELALHYIAKLCDKHGMGTKGFSPEFMDSLVAYEWPGNIREFVNAVERAILVAADEPTLYPKHLPTQMRIDLARSSARKEDNGNDKPVPDLALPAAGTSDPGKLPKLKAFRKIAAAEAERKYLKDLIDFADGDLRQVCKVSGLSRSRLYELLKKHNLPSRLHGQPE
jgi:two-component system NtrC family response regulator